jgi:hypothetical protein
VVAPESGVDGDDAKIHDWFDGGGFVEIRKFIIVKARANHSLCV